MSPSAERGAGAARRAAAWGVPLALAVLLAALLWRHREAILGAGLFAAAASPETQVRELLARRERVVIDGLGPGGARAELAPVRFGDVAVQVDGGAARVLAMVEARGLVTWREQRVELGYIGREAFGLSRCPATRWCPEGGELPALAGVLAALQARAEAASPPVRVRAWQIRVERERATAGEDDDALLPGGAAERRRSLSTLRREGDRWVFVEGS